VQPAKGMHFWMPEVTTFPQAAGCLAICTLLFPLSLTISNSVVGAPDRPKLYHVDSVLFQGLTFERFLARHVLFCLTLYLVSRK
jgi:hypothetical protein